MKSRRAVTWCMVLSIMLAACGGAPTSGAGGPAMPIVAGTAAPIRDALLNMECPTDMTESKKALLKDGVFEVPIVPGAATKLRIELGPLRGYGDLNSDGAEDAVVTLTSSAGGTAILTHAALVMNEKGSPNCAAIALLGDHIIVTGVEIRGGKVIANVLERKPGEPLTSPPTVAVTRTFERTPDGLREVK